MKLRQTPGAILVEPDYPEETRADEPDHNDEAMERASFRWRLVGPDWKPLGGVRREEPRVKEIRWD